VWLAGGGLLMSSMFFLSHSAILGLGPFTPESGMNLWWRMGWIPVVCMPYAWYLVMLWYASYWDDPQSPIHQRHKLTLFLATLLAVSTVGLVLLFNALPSFNQIIQLKMGGVLSIGGIPVLMVVYPLYLMMSLGFSLDVLLHPGIPGRLMGQYARQRAQPWLLMATLSLLMVSLLVGAVILWGISISNKGIDNPQSAYIITTFDLAIDLLIAITTLSVGQAIVSYEIFTGKVLPSRGLKRYWQMAALLSFGFGMIISWAILFPLQPIYLLLLSIVLMTVIYALLSWRSFIEQERYIKTLRPFITSQHLYDQLLLQKPSPIDFDITEPFFTLCNDILSVKQAYLIPLGIFGPLVGSGISYPTETELSRLEEILPDVRHQLTVTSGFAPVLLPRSSSLNQNSFVLPLWSERGLIGALVLGEKQNGSLFTQEEVEIARTVGERLIDSKASSELAHRLMGLQRQQLAETQVIDQRTRRTLHDDILPRLHTAILNLTSNMSDTADTIHAMSEIHHQLTSLLSELPSISDPELARLGLVESLRKTVEDEFHSCFDNLTWEIDARVLEKANSISSLAAEVLYHATREAIRNAARHARHSESSHLLNLDITMTWEDRLVICIQDNGIGLEEHAKKGEHNGHGLALHSTLMAVVGGSLAIESISGKNTQVILKLPA
jgi:two-component sensor histidine kinase